MLNTYKTPIYKAIVISFGVMLAGQYARYAAQAFDLLPEANNTIQVVPYPIPKPEVTETLEMAAVYERNTELLLALQGNALCDGQYNDPLFQPCGQALFDPLPMPIKKPERK